MLGRIVSFDKGICYSRDLMNNLGNYYEYGVFYSEESNSYFPRYHRVIDCNKRFMKKKN